MNRQPVKSSNVVSVGYEAETRTLEIQFKSGVYQYAGVPPETYANLLTAESIGRYVAQEIRAKFKGIRVDVKKE